MKYFCFVSFTFFQKERFLFSITLELILFAVRSYSLCKDNHLYKRIHIYKETLPVNKIMSIIKQIAQVSVYLLFVYLLLIY